MIKIGGLVSGVCLFCFTRVKDWIFFSFGRYPCLILFQNSKGWYFTVLQVDDRGDEGYKSL